MPILEIPNYGPVSFPEGMSEAEIQARAQQLADRVEARLAYKPDYRNLGLGKLAASGLSRGVTGLGSLVTDLIPAMIGSATGNDEYAKEQLAEAAAKRAKVEEESPTAFRSYKDVDGIRQGLGYVAETGGELVPDMLAMLLGGGLPGALAKRGVAKGAERLIAKRAASVAADEAASAEATKAYADKFIRRATSQYGDDIATRAAQAGSTAQLAGLYGTSLGLNTPDVFQGIYEKTGTLEPGIALVAGAGQAVLDSIVPARILSQFSKESRNIVANKLLQRSTLIPPNAKYEFAKSVLATSASEGATEGAQELLSMLAEQAAGSKEDLFGPENIDRIVNASIKGAVGGGLFGTPGSIVEARQKKGEAERIIAERKAANAPPAEVPAVQDVPDVPEMPTASTLLGAATPAVAPTPAPAPTDIAEPDGRPVPPAEGVSTTPAMMAMAQKWTDANLKATLDMQRAKPPEKQNKPLIAAIEAEIATRAAAQGAANAPAVEPIQPSPATVAPSTGESVGMAGEPSGLPPTEGVGVSESAGVVSPEPPAGGIAGGEGAVSPALEELHREMVEIAKQRIGTMTAGGRIPFKNSPARAKFDALGIQLEQKRNEWKALTGEEVDVQSLFTGEFKGPTNVAPAPAPTPAPAPVAPTPAPAPAPAPVEPVSETPVAGYKTAKGSTYVVFEDGTTQRDKAPRPEHPGDVGLKERTVKTIYIDGDASRLSAAGVENMEGARVILDADGTASLVWKNSKTGKLGSSPTSSKIQYHTEPAVGRSPLELWQPRDDVQGHEAYAGMHAGNKITEITPKKEAAAPEAEAKPKFTAAEKLARAEEAQRKADEAAKGEAEVAPTEVETEAKPAEPAEPKVKKEPKPRAKKEPKAEAEPEKDNSGYTKEKRLALQQQRAAEVKQVTAQFESVTGTGYRQNDKIADDVTPKDIETVHQLLTAPATTVDADARTYFSKVPRIIDALHNLAFDIVNETPHFRKSGERAIEAKFFEGMGGKSAGAARAWVEKSLSAAANKEFNAFLEAEVANARKTRKALEEHQATDKKKAKYEKNLKKQLAAEEKEAAADASKELRASQDIAETSQEQEFEPDEIDLDLEGWMNSRDNLFAGATSQFAIPLHPAVRNALSNGQLDQALRLMVNSTDGRTRDLAKVFANVGLTSRVSIIENLTDAAGNRVPGYFDPKTNSVVLDSELGMNTHTLFHELSHAATSHVLANPSHPVTKQLTNIFNDVKDTLDTAYGAQSLDEFVAEAWANDEFKAQLNSINPKGEAITAWQRFTNTIRNFFRRLMGREAVPIETAFDVADKAIMSILSPSPTYRDGTALYAATVNPRDPNISDWLNEKTDWLATLPAMNQERADKVNQFMRDVAGSKAKKIAFAFLPMDTFVDIAKKYLPDAPLVNALINERKGDEYRRNQKIESVIIEVEKWAKAVGVAVVEKFDSIVYESTTAQVDPTRARSFYDNKFPKDPKAQQELLATYDRLHKELNALGAPAVRTYKLMRETYADLRKEVLDSLDARVNETITDPEARKKFKNELLKKLAEKGEIDPYFPLTRNGKFWLSFHAPTANGTTEYYVEASETEVERDRRITDLKNAGAKNIQKFSNLSEISYKNVPNTAFVHGVLQTMDFHRPSDVALQKDYDAAMEGILRLYLTTMPETAFAKSFAARKGVLGFRKDSIRALRERSYSMSRQLSNMKYAAALTQVRQKMADYVTKLGKSGSTFRLAYNTISPKGTLESHLESFRNEKEQASRIAVLKKEGALDIREVADDNQLAKEYFDQMNKRISFAISPTVSKTAQMLNTISFSTLLGFNLSSAVVNLSQIPLIVFPYLGGKYGYGSTTKAIDDATRAFMGSGRSRLVSVMGASGEKIKRPAMPSLDNIDFDAPGVPNSLKKYQPMVEAARRMGQFNRSQMSDVLEAEDRTSALARINAASGFFMHHGERFNREVTLMAAYDLEMQRLNSSKASAVEKSLTPEAKQTLASERAIYMTELNNGGTSAAAAAPIAQNAIGRVLFMFKSYGVKMNYLLFKTLNESMRGESPEVRAIARKQLAGIMGSAALFAGLQGLPLFGVVAMIYNLFKDDDDEDFGAVVRSYAGETAYKGLINAMTNLAVAERIGLSNLIFKESPMAAGSATVVDSLTQTLGGPFIGVANRMERGIKLMADGHVERGLESMLPVAVGNAMKGIRYGVEGASTLRGDPVIGDVNAWNAGAQMLGFTPAEYTRTLEINASLKGIEKAIIEERSHELRKLNTANHVGDADGAEEARAKLEKLYGKYPELGNLESTIERSQRAFDMTEPVNGIIMNNKLKDRLLEIKAEQEGN